MTKIDITLKLSDISLTCYINLFTHLTVQFIVSKQLFLMLFHILFGCCAFKSTQRKTHFIHYLYLVQFNKIINFAIVKLEYFTF